MSTFWINKWLLFVVALGALAICGAFWGVLNGRYLLTVCCALGVVLSVYCTSRLRDWRRAILDSAAKKYSATLERLPFEVACGKAEDGCASVPSELAQIGGFSPPKGTIRHRYFEWCEVVFRIEEGENGATRCVFKNSKNA